jgi:hypothetical protein
MEVSKETLEVACQSLNERSRTLAEISRVGLTEAIREAAKGDLKKTYTAWAEVEKLLIEKEKQ